MFTTAIFRHLEHCFEIQSSSPAVILTLGLANDQGSGVIKTTLDRWPESSCGRQRPDTTVAYAVEWLRIYLALVDDVGLY